MKKILMLSLLSLSLVSCSSGLSTPEKAQAANIKLQQAPNVSGVEQPQDKCLTSVFEYSNAKKEGDVATVTLKYQTGAALLASLEGPRSLATPEGCNRLNAEIKKLTGSMVTWETVELSWNTKTGKKIASRTISSEGTPEK